MLKKIVSHVRKVHSRLRERAKSARSPQWDTVRDAHLSLHPTCAACGGTESLQVHHIVPFHVEASRELDPSNLITLCMGERDCHLHVGHGGAFRFYNPDVVRDALLASASFFRRRARLLAEIRRRRRRD